MGDLEKPGKRCRYESSRVVIRFYSALAVWCACRLAAHQSLDASTKGICVIHFVNSPWMPLWRTVPGGHAC